MNEESLICPVCGKRKREKGRIKKDGTIWYRSTCRICRDADKKTEERKERQKTNAALIREVENLKRYKRALDKLCDIKCLDVEDVLRKFADKED